MVAHAHFMLAVVLKSQVKVSDVFCINRGGFFQRSDQRSPWPRITY